MNSTNISSFFSYSHVIFNALHWLHGCDTTSIDSQKSHMFCYDECCISLGEKSPERNLTKQFWHSTNIFGRLWYTFFLGISTSSYGKNAARMLLRLCLCMAVPSRKKIVLKMLTNSKLKIFLAEKYSKKS